MPRLLCAGATLLAACSFGADLGGTRYQCGTGERCPDDQTCVGGFCAAGAPDAGDLSAPQLVDDFAMPPFDPIWEPYTSPGCTIAETGGKAVLTFTGTGDSFCGLTSQRQIDLSTSAVVIDSIDLPRRENFVSYLQAVDPTDDETRVELGLDDGDLTAADRTAGVDGLRATIAYDRVMHRYWRLHGTGAQLALATSPDAVTWTALLTVTPAFDTRAVAIGLGAGHYATVVPAGAVTAAFPGVNAP